MTLFYSPLWAYLDPFTGSLIFQVLAALLIGSGVMLRKYLFAPITWLFRRRGSRQEDTHRELYE